jgi:putative tryptophan/tyrosine transport system substrate-binding protein
MIAIPFLLLLAVLATPLAADAQPAGKVARVGRLSPISASVDAPLLAAFRQGLRDLGWVEGQNITIESRFADGRIDRLPALASELVRLKADVIVAGSSTGGLVARRATAIVPIVVVTTGDPVASGLVGSLARPEGNLTGVTALAQELGAKELELLTRAVPGARRVAVLSNPAYPGTPQTVREVEGAARALGVQLRVLEVRDPRELEAAFATMISEHANALMVLTDPMFVTHRERIVALAAERRLPAIYAIRQYVDAGGLMFYGASLVDMYRRSAGHVDKILKGAKPADLPIEQANRFELVINLRAARALGLTIPPSLLLRADQVIE